MYDNELIDIGNEFRRGEMSYHRYWSVLRAKRGNVGIWKCLYIHLVGKRTFPPPDISPEGKMSGGHFPRPGRTFPLADNSECIINKNHATIITLENINYIIM